MVQSVIIGVFCDFPQEVAVGVQNFNVGRSSTGFHQQRSFVNRQIVDDMEDGAVCTDIKPVARTIGVCAHPLVAEFTSLVDEVDVLVRGP